MSLPHIPTNLSIWYNGGEVPMTIALMTYVAYLAIFCLVNWAVIYHVRKYRYPNDASSIVIAIYILVTILIVIGTLTTIGVF